MIYKCKFCDYTTAKKYNFARHCDNKHLADEIIYNQEMDSIVNDQNTTEKYYCLKCYKEYNSPKYLKEHEEKCNGMDVLTCPTCMKTFAHYQSKYRHMKKNNCTPKSKLHYQNPNISHVNSHNTYNTNNNNTNNNNCHNTYNITINDFGKERTDYITVDKLINILRSNNIIPNYIDCKHFNENFPENRNIKFENNVCYVRKQDKWQPITIDKLSSSLLQTNTNELAKKYNSAKDIIEGIIQNVDVMEYIEKKFDYLDLMTNKNKYKEALDDIKCLIKSNRC
jgi:hypothetical protein